jgi:hypothetical protein
MLLAFLSLASGLVLDTVTLARREMKRMTYLAIPVLAPGLVYPVGQTPLDTTDDDRSQA